MGAWADFRNRDVQLPGSLDRLRAPDLAQTLKSRPLRAIALVATCLLTIFLFFAAIGGPGHVSLKNAIGYTGVTSGNAKDWLPTWSEASRFKHSPLVDSEEDEKGLKDPYFTKDAETGLEYPPDIRPASLNKYKRAKATFVSLVRNGELGSMRDSMRQVEAVFNRKAGYPWVFLNDEEFSAEFKAGVRQMTRSEIYFGVIPKEHWSYPDYIDQTKAASERQRMEDDHVIYGGSESYRHMCRFNSGFFYKHPLMDQFDWYWRVEPGVEFFCDLDYDPFLFMERNNKTYSFTVAIFEYHRTIESLWDTVRDFVKLHPDYVAPDNSLHFLVDDIARGFDAPYNLCHFWSNFEIASLNFFRSKEYNDYFNYLDKTGNFFYERWGDAPVHSIAAALFLPKDRLHQWDDIAYRHNRTRIARLGQTSTTRTVGVGAILALPSILMAIVACSIGGELDLGQANPAQHDFHGTADFTNGRMRNEQKRRAQVSETLCTYAACIWISSRTQDIRVDVICSASARRMKLHSDASISDELPECSLLLPPELYNALSLKADELVALQCPSWPRYTALCFASSDDSVTLPQLDRHTANFLSVPDSISTLKAVKLVKCHPVTLQHIFISVPSRLYQLAKDQADLMRDHLSSKRLLRQGSSFYLKQLDLHATAAMCEPVLQGVFRKDKTSLTILSTPEMDLPKLNGYHLDLDMEDLSIDESFLSAELLDHADSDDELQDDLQSVTSISSSAVNGSLKGSNWHIAKAESLAQPVPPEFCPELGSPGSDICVFTHTRHLARLGMHNGDLVLLRYPSSVESSHVGRLFASDLLLESHPNVDVLLPPLLLFNVLGHLDTPGEALIEVKLLSRAEIIKSVPVASSITLARISTALTSQKMYQNVFLKALKQYLRRQSGHVIVKEGDLLAVPLDGAEARWSEEESWELPKEDEYRPTALAYFKVASMSLPKAARLSTGLEGGKFGAVLKADSTQVLQLGVKQTRLPSESQYRVSSYFSIASPPSGRTTPLLASLVEYMAGAMSSGISHLDLILSFLLQGAHNSGKKTLIGQAAAQTGLNVVEVDCFGLVGDSEVRTEANLKAKVERAIECAPCILLLSNADALARKSQAVETGQDSRLVAAVQNCVEELREAWATSGWPVILAATTSDVDKIPPALLASFKTQFTLEAPAQLERFHLLQQILAEDVLSPDVDLDSIATQTAALVTGDLVALVQKARLVAQQRALANQPQLTFHDVRNAMLPLLQSDLLSALNAARSSYSESIGAPKIPNVTWDDVGGLASVKSDILDTIQLPLQHPELFASGMKQRSGILLYGPPGTGKTLLAKAVATSCSLNFFSVKGPELLNMYIGESEANVRRIFQRAREAKPCCIFFDELDSVAPKRGNQGDSGGVMDRIVSQLLAELDGMAEGSGSADVFVIGATNRPDLLDPALLRPGRFDRMLYLGVSEDHESQFKILQALTRKFQLDSNVDLQTLAQSCPFNFTGADLYALCSDAMLKAMARKADEVEQTIQLLNSQPPRDAPGAVKLTPQYYLAEMATPAEVQVEVSQVDFEQALKELEPSVSSAEMLHYKMVQQKFASSTLNNGQDKGKSKSKG